MPRGSTLRNLLATIAAEWRGLDPGVRLCLIVCMLATLVIWPLVLTL